MREPWHGTIGGYTNHRCRCADCRKALMLHQRDYRARHPERDPHTGRLREIPKEDK